ncbi:efflux RND transporter periplasmic adaptor subunit [Spiribacter vilamensis]|uniref:RND family efflux transporter MFP subunit n=1 Tax=Spiribacter vilamensis TaxID=531306 RepID=A0A4Q8D051_9GAMM|nr:efflux RND transporter periplasmic adaptor subunit [Spiribacter vilamensis]RZU98580.1 RND family efflux transporter MFP subunit [Spiribacter vilamensis]TVO60161.1 efflux RND transporter periplasmic adaptor subunit [Spiribacter vilamensis]
MIRQPLLLAVLSLALIVVGPAGAQSDAAPVRLSPVTTGEAVTRLEAVGQSRARRSVTLYPEATGIVTAIKVDADQRVEAGGTLLTLDAEAERNEVERTRAELRDARRRLERYEPGIDQGMFSPTTIDDARREVELARLALERARIALNDRERLAPFAGYTGMTDIEVGQRVDPDTPITTLDDRTALTVRFQLAGQYFGQLTPGDEITLAAWARPGATVTGTIEAVDSRIDTTNGTFRVEARIDNRDDRFRPGMRFRVSTELPGPTHLRVPATSLQWGDNGAYVWIVRDGQARRVGVSLIARQSGHVLVEGELERDDRVVSEGAQRMRPGIEVRVIDPADLDDYPAIEAIRDTAAQ